jgi:multidrug resistance efflux pump
MKTRLFVRIVLLNLAVVLLSGCAGQAQAQVVPTPAFTASQPVPDQATAEGRLKPAKTVDLSFAASGRVVEVLAAEGQAVTEGQLLARLEGAEIFTAQEAAAKLESLQAEQDLLHLQEDAFLELSKTSEELEEARKAYDAVVSQWNGGGDKYPSKFDAALEDYIEAEKDVRDAQVKIDAERDQPVDAPARVQAEKRLNDEKARRADAYRALVAGYEDPQEGKLSDNRTPLVRAIARLEAAQLRLSKLQGKADPEKETLLKARQESAEAVQAAAQENIRMLELRAPWAGRLESWDLKVGEAVLPGQAAGALAAKSSWYIETTDLAENDVVMLNVGDRMSVTVNALPGEQYTGIIEFIQGKGEKIQGDMTYQVRIRMEQNDPRWYWNMIVKVTSFQSED